MECYERLKNKGSTGMPAVMPFSTGITYALLDRVVADKIPLITSGYGRADGADGRSFPVFVPPATYWGGADIAIHYIAGEEGGYGNLKGKKIALVYHDSAYGKEPIKTLQALASQHGFEFSEFPVPHPGLEAKGHLVEDRPSAAARLCADVGLGVMNATAIKEAAAVGFPRENSSASGGRAMMPTWCQPVMRPRVTSRSSSMAWDPIWRTPTDQERRLRKGKGSAKSAENTGEVAYNRGLQSAFIPTEALRTAMAEFGNKPITGEQVAWAMDRLDITDAR